MAAPPPVVVVAKIRERREKPRREIGVGPQTKALLVQAHECGDHEVLGVGCVVNIAPGEGEKRALPPRDKRIQRAAGAGPKGLEGGAIAGGVRIHLDQSSPAETDRQP
jgi:hypothetical protein